MRGMRGRGRIKRRGGRRYRRSPYSSYYSLGYPYSYYAYPYNYYYDDYYYDDCDDVCVEDYKKCTLIKDSNKSQCANKLDGCLKGCRN